MIYRAVNGRCAVVFEDLNPSLPISVNSALQILQKNGFLAIIVDIGFLARGLVGVSSYHRGARMREAPNVVDCSSLTKWLYAQLGIWLPRLAIEQRELGEPVQLNELVAGDLVFTTGSRDRYFQDLSDGVGHVGVYTNGRVIVHTANSKKGVVCCQLDQFLKINEFRGARRYFPNKKKLWTFETPPGREVETSSSIGWIILDSLPPCEQH
jgi:hypothetical protein